MPAIDFAGRLKTPELVKLFRECTPRLLVVTDGALDASTGGFGLSRFVDTLKATTIHGMTPIVVTRDRGLADEVFDDLAIGRFDVVFLFGYNGEGSPLSAAATDRIAAFMEAGGGVFATGDHDDLGAGMCGQLPRVRHMRRWAAIDTPDAADSTRLTTNLPGTDGIFAFGDQSDDEPQRLYANFDIPPDYPVFVPVPPPPPGTANGPHPLLVMPGGSALDIYPDHPHEGECRLPDDLGTTFWLNGAELPEWPSGGLFPWFFARPVPRHVASTMSYGDGFPGKAAVTPRAFIAIAAYNGQVAGKGRVVTDATWHHYVNINFDGFTSAQVGRIQRYWSNLANWLMPVRTRKCLFPFFVLKLLLEHPLAEEIRIPERERLTPPELVRLGTLVATALSSDAGSLGQEVVADLTLALTEPDRLREIVGDRTDLDMSGPARDAMLATLGAVTVVLVRQAAVGELRHDPNWFDGVVRRSADAAREAVAHHRAGLERAVEAADGLAKALTG